MDDHRGWYAAYLRRCNDHRFEELAEFVAPDVVVNGGSGGLDAYVAGLRRVVDAFSDYHWELQHLLVDGPWLAAHLQDTGTHTGIWEGIAASGRPVRTVELAVYRLRGGKIVEVWTTSDTLDVVLQLGGGS